MGQKLAAYNANGNITAFYDTEDSPAPEGAIVLAITDGQWQECMSAPGYTIQGGLLVAPIPPTDAEVFAQTQVNLCLQIDGTAQSVYNGIGSASPGMLAEYQQANTDAQAYKAAGYPGTLPDTIACWATASGMTDQAATDNIIATAAAWIACLNAIRSTRLLGKASVNLATTVEDAQAAADSAITKIQAIASAA